MNKTILLWTAAILLVMVAGAASAQPPAPQGPQGGPPQRPEGPPRMEGAPSPPPPQAVEESRELLEQVMVTRLAKRLELNDEQTVVLMRRTNEIRQSQQKMRKERMEVLRELRNVIKQEQDEAALAQLMSRLGKLDADTKALPQELRKILEEFNLSVWQKAKFEVFLSEFDGEMRRIMQQSRGRSPMMNEPGKGMPGRGPNMEGADRPRAPGEGPGVRNAEGGENARRPRAAGPNRPGKQRPPQKPDVQEPANASSAEGE